MPSLSYSGTIIDTLNQRILIQVRAGVHTHPDGAGVSINAPNARSQDDLAVALQLKDIGYFSLFVIEPSVATYKTGRFDWDVNNNEYLNIEINLTLQEICNHIQ